MVFLLKIKNTFLEGFVPGNVASSFVGNTIISHNFGDFILSKSGTRSMRTVTSPVLLKV